MGSWLSFLTSKTEDVDLEMETREVIRACLRDYVNLPVLPSGRDQERLRVSMGFCINDMLEQHRVRYEEMVRKTTNVAEIATETFRGGETNWGRVVALVAYGAVACELGCPVPGPGYISSTKERRVEVMAERISNYLLEHQREWMVQNQAWKGFVRWAFFIGPTRPKPKGKE